MRNILEEAKRVGTIFWASRNAWNRSVSIYGINRFPDGSKSYWQSVTIQTISENDPEFEPHVTPNAPIELSEDDAQSLMDALWEVGVKPSGGEGHTAHIRSLNKHLEDMRKIVSSKLKVDL